MVDGTTPEEIQAASAKSEALATLDSPLSGLASKLSPLGGVATGIVDRAESYVEAQRVDIHEKGVLNYFASKMLRWGATMLISGFIMAFVAYHVEMAGKQWLNAGAQGMESVTAAFSNLAQPAVSVPWGGWNVGQDLHWVGAAAYNTVDDVYKGITDIGPAIFLTFTKGIPGAFTWVIGGFTDGVGMFLENLFPWLILVGGVMVLMGLLLKVVEWYRVAFMEYIKPRATIRRKASLRRWLQRPFDKVLLPKSIADRAAAYNKQEAAVNALAFDPLADQRIADEINALHTELEAKKETEKKAAKLAGVDESYVAKLEKGRSLGPRKWAEQIQGPTVTVVMVSPSTSDLQDSLLGAMAHRNEAKAIAKVVDDSGNVGGAAIGLSDTQATNLGPTYNAPNVYWHDRLLDARPRDVEGRVGGTVITFQSITTSDKPFSEGSWFHLPEIGLYFRYVRPAPKEPAPMTTPTSVSSPPRTSAPTTTVVPSVEPTVEPTTNELTMAEWDALSPDEQANLIQEDPNRVPAEVWTQRSSDVELRASI